MANATKVSGTEVQASMIGLDVYMVQIVLGGTESEPVTLDTGFRSVAHVQATWADADIDAGAPIVTVSSGGVLSIESTADITGSGNSVWVLVFGYRG